MLDVMNSQRIQWIGRIFRHCGGFSGGISEFLDCIRDTDIHVGMA